MLAQPLKVHSTVGALKAVYVGTRYLGRSLQCSSFFKPKNGRKTLTLPLFIKKLEPHVLTHCYIYVVALAMANVI